MTGTCIDANFFIYMNTPIKNIDSFIDYYEKELTSNRTFTNLIVLDELIYISKKKYGIPNNVTLEFIDSMILPFTSILPLEESDYLIMKETLKYCPKPSDALIVASMKRASITDLLSEDSDFDMIKGIKRFKCRDF